MHCVSCCPFHFHFVCIEQSQQTNARKNPFICSSMCQLLFFQDIPLPTHAGAQMQLLWLVSSAVSICLSAIFVAYLYTKEDVTPSHTAQTLESDAFSSVFCEGDTPATRQCVVTNLCYLPADRQFVMIESPETRYVGISNASDLQPLLKLNPVVGHNLFDLNLVPVTSQWLTARRAALHRGDFLVFEPFKPDNLMHVLHDDLLPVYLTMYKLCHGEMAECRRRWRPLVRAASLSSPLVSLYAALWDSPLTLTGDLDPATPHCLERAHLGLRSDSLWYQYGFERPQSPLSAPALQRQHLEDFRALLLARLAAGADGRSAEPPPPPGYVLLLSRTESRRILNEPQLAAALEARLGRPVRRLALEEVSVPAAAALAAGADLLVGMHGAGLALALLLPPGGALLELFPYGLRPERYRPYRRLCQLRGLSYRAWVNGYRAASVPPGPDAAPDLGGLAHLEPEERRRVETLQEVPDTLCCADPAFLYRVYQDTAVDTAAVCDAAAAALLASDRPRRRRTRGALFFPGPARHLTARAEGDSRLLEWRPPLNAPPDAGGGAVSYRVWVRQGDRVEEYRVRRPRLTLETDCGDCQLQVWVQAELEGRTGPVLHETFQIEPDG